MLLCLCGSVNVLWLANIICHPFFLSQSAMTIAKQSKTEEYHPLTLAPFCPPFLPPLPSLHAEWQRNDQPRSLISIAGLRNTGPVVDTLASYPTGADKLLASLSVQSEDSQPGSRILNYAAGHWDHLSCSALCLNEWWRKCGNDKILLCDSGSGWSGLNQLWWRNMTQFTITWVKAFACYHSLCIMEVFCLTPKS